MTVYAIYEDCRRFPVAIYSSLEKAKAVVEECERTNTTVYGEQAWDSEESTLFWRYKWTQEHIKENATTRPILNALEWKHLEKKRIWNFVLNRRWEYYISDSEFPRWSETRPRHRAFYYIKELDIIESTL